MNLLKYDNRESLLIFGPYKQNVKGLKYLKLPAALVLLLDRVGFGLFTLTANTPIKDQIYKKNRYFKTNILQRHLLLVQMQGHR